MKPVRLFLCTVALLMTAGLGLAQDPPSSFDLRDVSGENFVTSVKSQSGGTCWTHGAMAAMEGNLLMTGAWAAAGEVGEPNLAEYHLDWWNGFNTFNNDDDPGGGGLTVHEGGDYLVTAAYLTRCEGAVRDIDGQSYSSAPPRSDPDWHYYYARDIEWFTAGSMLENIDTIKNHVMAEGVVGTCMCYDGAYIQGTIHYQPPSTTTLPNHAIAIVGWDDNKVTQAPQNGAWLCKNSWGSSWGESGYFWISYYDKHCCQEEFMGAISYQDVEPLAYDHIYYHDYHGWRDTLSTATEAFNAFTASGGSMEAIQAVSFYTSADNVNYTVKIYDRYVGGQLLDELASQTGTMAYRGFHTVDLDTPLSMTFGDDFYVYLDLANGGQAYDRTSDVPVLLGSSGRVMVESSASPGESFYRDGGTWVDLTTLNDTANFCIKALSVEQSLLYFDYPDPLPAGQYPPGLATELTVEITDGFENYVPGSGLLHYRFDANDPYSTVSLTSLGNDLFTAMLPNTTPGDVPEYYFSAETSGGSTVYSPVDAPASVYTFDVCFVETLFEDDFETHQNWTVQNTNVSTGEWERADPAGTDAQPEDDHTSSGTQCYVTGKNGGSSGDDDLDGGPTRLISPVFDLSGGDAEISCYVWFYHSDYGGQQPLEIEITNGGSWVDVLDMTHSPAWNLVSFKASDYVSPTNQMQVRFSATDNPNDDVVEALVDDFSVDRFVYEASLWADAYSIDVSTATTINFSLDADAANAGRTYLILGSLSGTSPGYALPGGATLPLNWDLFTDVLLQFLGTPVCQNFYGTLDGSGLATATLDTYGAIDPGLVGEIANFAFLLGHPPSLNYASNAIAVPFTP